MKHDNLVQIRTQEKAWTQNSYWHSSSQQFLDENTSPNNDLIWNHAIYHLPTVATTPSPNTDDTIAQV